MTAESASPNPDQKYIALIGDLRHSRRAEDRAGLQRRLIEQVEEQRSEPDGLDFFEKMIPGVRAMENALTPVAITVTSGDEVQALLPNGFSAFMSMFGLAEAISPATMTFGLGLGTLTTDISENAALIDGPAFHNAREALLSARQKGFTAAAKGFGGDDTILTALLCMTGFLRQRWTDRQDEFIELILREELKRIEIARQQGVSPSVVSESLKAAGFHEFAQGTEATIQLLTRHLPAATP